MLRNWIWIGIIELACLSAQFIIAGSLESFECDEMYFQCRISHKCISKSFICDGEPDCGEEYLEDFSDEQSCHLLSTPEPTPCLKDEFQCTDRLCIPNGWVCDGEHDCADGSDETIGCSSHICGDGFRCKSIGCIPKEWECDGNRDCPDNSDEDHCPQKPLSLDDCNVHDGKYKCADHKKCIKLQDVCNNHADCADGSDEGKSCLMADACSHKNCSLHEKCVNLPEGPICLQLCQGGYKYRNGVCEDIDECETFGRCDQICTNTQGSYNCSCVEGYTFSPEHNICKVDGGEALLLFSSNDQIRAHFLSSKVHYQIADSLPHATAIAYDGMNVYWSTIKDGEETIVKANEHGENRRVIVTSGIGSPEDLAVDWITQTLYFTDPKFKRIGVCSNDGYVCSVIHNKDVDLPRALVLHSSEGLMYWTDWGARPLIGRSGMDGSYPFEFVKQDIHWPNGLSLDLGSQRLFWADAKMMTIECIKLDGSDRRKIHNEAVKHPFSIEVFEDRIYWSDWDNNQIQACNKFTGHDCHVIERERKHKIYGIHIYHPTLLGTKVMNPCYHAHCSDLCLLAPKSGSNDLSYSCVCPSHKKLSKDFRTCVEDTNLEAIMIASGQNLTRVEHKTFGGFQTETVNINHLRKIGSIAYNPNKDQIILSDLIMKVIVGYDWVKKETDTLVEHVGRVIGMDVDYYANNLYWVDEEKKTVEVLNLKNKARKTILRDFGNEIPTDIALVLEQGYMFVAFRSSSGAHIDRFSMDGRLTTRTHVVETELIGPLSLFYDSTLGLLWSDRNGGVIMISDSEGVGRHKYQEMSSAPMDLTTLDTDVFWTTYGSNKLFWSHKYDSSHYTKEFVIDGILETDNIRLIGIHTHELPRKSLCSNMGNCSHLCLLSGNNAVCACPDGMELEFNKETCQPQHICKEDEYKCNSGECIKRALRCNGQMDCKNGDDEEHCVKSCPHNMFACANGRQCINEADKCNNKPDCDDSSDEHNCDIHGNCLSNEFHCGSGECVPNIVKCDAKDDCLDASDEEHCEHSVCAGEFRCDSGNCIPLSWECDGQIDCFDGSDEGDKCNVKESCDEFMCENGHCISSKMKCNGEDDCDDMSDERNCPSLPKAVPRNSTGSNSSNPQECPFFCSTDPDICLPLSAKCNGKHDCPGGEDENNCHTCSEEQFVCSTKKCIPKQWVCDNVDDCGDNSDEKDCVNHTIALLGRKHYENVQCDGFRCIDSDICISVQKLCDTHPDCPDGSDEKGLCGGKGCENAGCNQVCHETPEGPRCDCHPGYQIQGDGRNCNDINECEKRSSCSQLCQNTLGSFKCTCYEPDYQLRGDRISCKAKGPEMRYYYATQKEIKYKSQSLQETKLVHRSKFDLNIKGMDIDVKNNTLYWTSENGGHLTKMSLNTHESEHISNLIRPTSLGYDWITGNVYILENSKEILACNFKVSKCTLVYTSSKEVSLERLIIDPISRLMFWFETVTYMMHHTKSVLKTSSMAGGEVKELLHLSNTVIGDIVADPLHKLIYWSDTSEKKIERCTYDGKDREVVVHSQIPPTSLAIFEDYLYWLNGNTDSHSPNQLEKVGTLTKYGLYGTAFMKYEQIRLLPRASFSEIKAVRLFQSSLQPQGKNKCKKFNCKEICLLGSDGPKCLCENGDRVKNGVKCPETDKNKKQFNVSESSRSTGNERGAGWTWFWIIFGLLSFSALGYATYYFYSHVYQHRKFGGNLSVFFNGERQQNETSEPTVRTALAPGQHHYENPILDVDQNPSLRIIVGNEIDIN